jgi:hypothetical protein
VIEGDVTFESRAMDFGSFPHFGIQTTEGSITLRTTGNKGPCNVTIHASGQVGVLDGAITFSPEPPPPQRPTQLKYAGAGKTLVTGTRIEVCPSSIGSAWEDSARWMEIFIGANLTASPDLLVISGTYAETEGSFSYTWEWSLTKQR